MSVQGNSADGRHDVVVIGAGVAGLVAARACARLGLSVLVLEASDAAGGCVGRTEIAGLSLDTGAEGFATRNDAVATLLGELGLGGDIVDPNPAGAWLRLPALHGHGALTVPMPKLSLLGIPGSPLASDVVAAIGWKAAIRAYLDRLRPVLTIGTEKNLGELVEKRMGSAVLDRLVAPISGGVYSADPRMLEVDAVAPGLNAAFTRAGSLSGAVSLLKTEAKPGAGVRGIRGGMHRLVDALLAELAHYGAEVRLGTRAVGLREEPNGSWLVSTESAGAESAGTEGAAETAVLQIAARAVVVATPSTAALGLLADARPDWDEADGDWAAGSSVEIVTLVLDAPALDSAPRGTGVLVGAGTPGTTAKALTHSTAKWAWLAEAAGPGRHVVRLSYGRIGEANPSAALGDDELTVLALRDASAILGVQLDAAQLVGSARTPWRDALSHAALGQKDRVAALRARLEEEPTLAVTGSWLGGTGLASVIPDATEAAGGIRRHFVHL
ncbi:protoporphyrinogen/coproporphyrinogen oxidase [Microterricola viridarii]|uniref:Oxygen-dependent protoporphyrinogen oxidase n=1 Tax=Microterricola viridarii TaxID=412690 RepID=A0A1H1LQV0_9MICO|nr:FAD-dependent oxidoreductase [Microterricola viridarii]SDR76730.1 oxygen-dependent protoporphyrinogen oxidase [Microterricola viridarii]